MSVNSAAKYDHSINSYSSCIHPNSSKELQTVESDTFHPQLAKRMTLVSSKAAALKNSSEDAEKVEVFKEKISDLLSAFEKFIVVGEILAKQLGELNQAMSNAIKEKEDQEVAYTLTLLSSHLAEEAKMLTGEKMDFLKEMSRTPVFSKSVERFLANHPSALPFDISVADLEEPDIPIIQQELTILWQEVLYKSCIHQTNQNFQSISKSSSIDTLLPSKKKEFDEYLEKYVQIFMKIFLDAFFKKGLKLRELQTITGIRTSKFIVQPHDFTNYQPSEFPIFRQKTPRDDHAYARVRQKHLASKVKRIRARFITKFEDFYLSMRDQVRLYKFASQTLKIAINDLSDDNVTNVKHEFYKTLEKEELEKKRKQSKKAYDELMAETTQALPKKTCSNKPSAKTKTHKLNPYSTSDTVSCTPSEDIVEKSSLHEEQIKEQTGIEKTILDLNKSYKTRLQLHPRVARWSESNLDLIRKFGPPYDRYDYDTLRYMRQCHNLLGIEKILSEEKLQAHYTFFYIVHNDSHATGRGLYATMQSPDGTQQSGIIYVAFNKETNLIYHAMFETFLSDNEVPLEEIQQKCNATAALTEEEMTYSPWENPSNILFTYTRDDRIVIEIGKKAKHRVTFVIEPLEHFC